MNKKLITSAILIGIFIASLMGLYLYNHIDKSDWWTGALCPNKGELVEKRGYDYCIIDGESYSAMRILTGRYYTNYTNSREIIEWQLVKG